MIWIIGEVVGTYGRVKENGRKLDEITDAFLLVDFLELLIYFRLVLADEAKKAVDWDERLKKKWRNEYNWKIFSYWW